MRDIHNTINVKRVLSPVAVADDTAAVGEIVDNAGFSAVEYIIALGSIADANATFAVLLEESDASDMTGATEVAAGDLIGTAALAGFRYDSDNKLRKLGYKGKKRYTRMTITPTGNGSDALICAVCVLGLADNGATSNPPA